MDPLLLPELVIVPVLLMLVVEIVMPLAIELLLLSTTLPVPVTPFDTVKIELPPELLFVKVLLDTPTVTAPLTVSAEVVLFSMKPVDVRADSRADRREAGACADVGHGAGIVDRSCGNRDGARAGTAVDRQVVGAGHAAAESRRYVGAGVANRQRANRGVGGQHDRVLDRQCAGDEQRGTVTARSVAQRDYTGIGAKGVRIGRADNRAGFYGQAAGKGVRYPHG